MWLLEFGESGPFFQKDFFHQMSFDFWFSWKKDKPFVHSCIAHTANWHVSRRQRGGLGRSCRQREKAVTFFFFQNSEKWEI